MYSCLSVCVYIYTCVCVWVCVCMYTQTLTYIHAYIHTDRPTDRKTNRQTDRQTGRQADRKTDKQSDRQTDGRTDRQTDRQTYVYIHPTQGIYIQRVVISWNPMEYTDINVQITADALETLNPIPDLETYQTAFQKINYSTISA